MPSSLASSYNANFIGYNSSAYVYNGFGTSFVSTGSSFPGTTVSVTPNTPSMSTSTGSIFRAVTLFDLDVIVRTNKQVVGRYSVETVTTSDENAEISFTIGTAASSNGGISLSTGVRFLGIQPSTSNQWTYRMTNDPALTGFQMHPTCPVVLSLDTTATTAVYLYTTEGSEFDVRMVSW